MADFFNQMKPSDWINLGGLALSGVEGLTGGLSSSRANELARQQQWLENQRQARQDEFTRQLNYYTAQQGARAGLGSFYAQANADRAAGRQALLNASPLGAEQMLAYQMARARGLSNVAENFQPLAPTSQAIAGLIRPTSNVLGAFTTPDFRATISPEATARSIAERRKALAGVDPTFQFGSMGDYGLPNLEKEVATYAQGVAADRLSRENQLLNLLTQQMQAASNLPANMQKAMDTAAQQQLQQQQQQQQSQQSQQTTQPKKTSWWKKVLNVAATAAPIVAAPFTGGTSLALIGAGSGALKGALSGGVKGALTGAAMGADTSAVGGGAAGAAAQRGAGEAASAAIKRAILNPRALTQLGGAAIGGPVEQAAQVISPFLSGASAAPRVMANQMSPQSLPFPMRSAGDSPQLLLPSLPVANPMTAFPGAVVPARPGVPLGPPSSGGVSGPATNNAIMDELRKSMASAISHSRGVPPPAIARNQSVMRAPTVTEQFRDTMSPVLDVLAGLGMPGAREASTTVPMSGSPTAEGAPLPTEQVMNSPLGVAILTALGTVRPGSVMTPSVPRLGAGRIAGYLPEISATSTPPSVPPKGPFALPAPKMPLGLPVPASPLGLPPGQYNLPSLSPSGVKVQLQLGNLLRQIEQYKNDPAAVRMLIQQMQPLLSQVR